MSDENRTPPFPFITDIIFQRGDVVFATDKRGRLVHWNSESEQLFGYAAGEVLGNPFDVICLAAPGGSEINLSTILAGRDFAGGVRCISKPGRELALYVYATAGRVQSGDVAGVVFVARDVSDFWRAEAAVLASEDRYRLLFEQSSDAVVLTNLQGRILEANPSTATLTGFTRAELVRMTLHDLIPPGKASGAETAVARLREAGPSSGRVDLRRRDGQVRTVELTASLVSIADAQRVLILGRDATDRVRAEQATRESERKYRTVFDSANDAVFIETVDGSILEVNDNACRLFGYTREELLKMKVSDLVPVEARAWLPRVTDAILRDRTFRAEAVNVQKSGRQIPVEISASTLELDDATRVLAIVRDISERKRTEAALAESENRYRTLFSDSLMGIYRTTPDGQIQMANPALVRMLGYESFAQLAERNLEKDGSGPEYQRDEFKRRIERDGRIVGLEVNWQTRDGRTLFVRESANAVRAKDGAVLYYEGTVEDISDRKAVEQALRENEANFRAMAENSADGVAVADESGRYVFVNSRVAEIFGYPVARLLEMSFGDLLRPGDARELNERYARRMRGETVPAQYELTAVRADGQSVPVEVSVTRTTWHGRPASFTNLRDIGQRRAAEQRLQESEEQFRRLVEMSPDGIAVHQDGRIVLVNAAGARLLGYELPEQLVGKPVLDIVHPEDRSDVVARIEQVLQRGKPGDLVEERFRRQDGSYVPVEVVNAPGDWKGKPAVQVVVRDISARRELAHAAEAAEAQMQAVLANSPDGIAAECDGVIAYANQRFAELYGYDSPAQITGLPVTDFLAPEDHDRVAEYTKARVRGDPAPTRYRFKGLRRDSTFVEVEITVSTYILFGRQYLLGFLREAAARPRR